MSLLPRISDLCPALGRTLRRPRGWTWSARGDEGEAAIGIDERASNRRFLRRRRRRAAWIDHEDGVHVFGKTLRLPDLAAIARATLQLGSKGALVEARHTLAAEGKLPRVARLLALGQRRRLGLVIEERLLFKALTEHRTLIHVIESVADDPDAQRAALSRAAELVLTLARAGMSHLDLNPKNVMLGPTAEEDCPVDIEQVVELTAERADLLAHAFGHLYSRGVQEHVPPGRYHAVALPALARGLGLDEVPEDALWAYEWFLGKSLRRRTRQRLARRGLERMGWIALRIAARRDVAPRPVPE